MIENLEAMMEEADETKAGSSVKNEDIIGKDLTLEIDTSGLVWPFFLPCVSYTRNVEALNPAGIAGTSPHPRTPR